MAIQKTTKPTESELEILSVLWEMKNASVRTVHESLSKHKDAGYTTTLKLMQIMHEKGLVARNESAKTHIYSPSFAREKAQEQYVGKMIRTLFSGSTSQLVLQALGKHKPTNQDLIDIKNLIEELEKK